MKIPFNVKYRPQIESGEYKVETRDGRLVRIICWDRVAKENTDADLNICVLVPEDKGEAVYYYHQSGKKWVSDKSFDLFIITPEPELSEFEQAVKRGFICGGLKDVTYGVIKDTAAELLDLARKEALKDLPRWKKVGANTGQINLYRSFLRAQNYLEIDGRRIMLSELEKLPGFKEE